MEKIQAVYIIKNTTSGKFYIGSSIDVEDRFKRHLKELECGKHHNIKMQNDYNLYGKSSFILDILEIISDRNILKNREDYYIDTLKAKDLGYNIASANFGDCLSHHPNRDKIVENITKAIHKRYDDMTEEERKNLGRWGEDNPHWNPTFIRSCKKCGKRINHDPKKRTGLCKHCSDNNRKGEKNPFYGKTHSAETRKKLSEAQKNRKRYSQPIMAGGIYFQAKIDAAKYYGISSGLVPYRLKSDKYPDWYEV